MSNMFIENRDAWLRMSDIDYVGQFVKAWLAFNAWYRSAYSISQDRTIIEEIKWNSNPVLNNLRPKLDLLSDDAIQFRTEIALLHQRLASYEVTTGKGAEKKRIWFTQTFLRNNPPMLLTEDRYGMKFSVELLNEKKIQASVTRKKDGVSLFSLLPGRYDICTIESQSDFVRLSDSQKGILRELCSKASPALICDLISHKEPDAPDIQCGAYVFRCGRDVLFAGVIEILYQMRCTLFHGELVPTKEAILCYEPAFRLVRRILDCVV